jgi:hypothetical protein
MGETVPSQEQPESDEQPDRLTAVLGKHLRPKQRLQLRHFEDVLEVELAELDRRRTLRRAGLRDTKVELIDAASLPKDGRTPDLEKLQRRHRTESNPRIDPKDPDQKKMRPRPVPCCATGLALSGGGIRSAAVCLGAIQSLRRNSSLESFDYLSTVSGGGYIGSCLSAAMSERGGGAFPFGDDISDSPSIAHLRNYSNYLLPRDRTAVSNLSETGAVVLRGLIANTLVTLSVILILVVLTQVAYPNPASLKAGGFLLQLIGPPAILGLFTFPFSSTLISACALVTVLVVWAAFRSLTRFDSWAGDTHGVMLALARTLVITTFICAFLDLQPIAIFYCYELYRYLTSHGGSVIEVKTLVASLAAFATAVSSVSGSLGRFLKSSQRSTNWTVIGRRMAAHVLMAVAGLALPIALWISYLYLSVAAIYHWAPPVWLRWDWLQPMINGLLRELPFLNSQAAALDLLIATLLVLIAFCFRANGYSLHGLYRDRLSRAFIFQPSPDYRDPETLDDLKLSDLSTSAGPYHIVNAAMNVQGSKEANKRGRGADFFIFTPDFIGSDLTLFAPTKERSPSGGEPVTEMEGEEKRLNLATAMAISGAAVSANMGSNTVRLLSPTLALLNIRLGYWMRNPRDLALKKRDRVTTMLGALFSKAYLMLEMLNLLDENSRHVYLSDGGHIENLGVYELLKRGCRVIVVIDAEADPTMSFGSLIKLERYARIDLGVRISLPWELITQRMAAANEQMSTGFAERKSGPHCAIGRITYENDVQGVMIYFKSSLTGDEKDYVLDYKRRHPDFPHETTGDQFFSEEQFEAYRALGFHMVEGFFGNPRSDEISFSPVAYGGWATQAAAVAEARRLLFEASPPTATNAAKPAVPDREAGKGAPDPALDVAVV